MSIQEIAEFLELDTEIINRTVLTPEDVDIYVEALRKELSTRQNSTK